MAAHAFVRDADTAGKMALIDDQGLPPLDRRELGLPLLKAAVDAHQRA